MLLTNDFAVAVDVVLRFGDGDVRTLYDDGLVHSDR